MLVAVLGVAPHQAVREEPIQMETDGVDVQPDFLRQLLDTQTLLGGLQHAKDAGTARADLGTSPPRRVGLRSGHIHSVVWPQEAGSAAAAQP